MNIADGLGVGAHGDGVLAVIHKLLAGHLGLVHSVAERSHRAVAVALNLHRRIALVFQLAGEMHMGQIVPVSYTHLDVYKRQVL